MAFFAFVPELDLAEASFLDCPLTGAFFEAVLSVLETLSREDLSTIRKGCLALLFCFLVLRFAMIFELGLHCK